MKNQLAIACLLSTCAILGCSPAGTASRPDEASARASERNRWSATIYRREWSAEVPESDHRFTCPADQAIVARSHVGNDRGPTRYECAMYESRDGYVRMVDTKSYGPFQENSNGGHQWSCPSDRVMVGRSHYGAGSSGESFYRCAIPVSENWGNDPMQVVSHGWSGEIPDSDTTTDCAVDMPGVMIGRGSTKDNDIMFECASMW